MSGESLDQDKVIYKKFNLDDVIAEVQKKTDIPKHVLEQIGNFQFEYFYELMKQETPAIIKFNYLCKFSFAPRKHKIVKELRKKKSENILGNMKIG